MSKFRFRLETLLKLRAADRQQKRVELAQAYQAERLLNRQAQQLKFERETTRRAARASAAPGKVNVDALVSAHRFGLLLQTQVSLLEERSQQLQEEIERRRTALVQAERQLRVLEKLRDRQQESHQSWQWEQELKELDEVASRSAWRKPQ